MLKNIPPIISPELLSVLDEMGHGDRICIGDGNFPGSSVAEAEGAILLRADGHGVPALLDAILQLIPLDEYVDTPAMVMEVRRLWRNMMTAVRLHLALMSALNSTSRQRNATVSFRPGRLRSTRISFCRRAS